MRCARHISKERIMSSSTKVLVTALFLFCSTSTAGAQERAPEAATATTASESQNENRMPQSIVVPPQEGGPDPGDPGQGRDAALFAVRPDLALVGNLTLATASIPWGTSVSLSSSAAAYVKGGRCEFRYAYRTRNQGLAAAAAGVNRILLGAANGPMLVQNALPALTVNAQYVASGHVLLKPGTWTLYVHADAAQQVVESDEQNNLRRVRVTVEGDCK